MTVRIEAITATDWSPLLGSPGEIVQDQADIEQCIDIILGTPKGSDPHRPQFGCDAWKWLDAPPAVAVPHIIVEAVDSLELWEPRIEIVRLQALISANAATVTVYWQAKGIKVVIKTEVSIGNNAA